MIRTSLIVATLLAAYPVAAQEVMTPGAPAEACKAPNVTVDARIAGCTKVIDEKKETGRWRNNRVENSHLPFRRRERAMNRFRRMKTLQKFASVHASIHNHFNQERHLISKDLYRERRSAALAEWRSVMG